MTMGIPLLEGLVIQMNNLLKKPARLAGLMFLGSVLASAQGLAQPGAVNYVEGQVRLDGETITNKQIGSAVVNAGHVLQTGNGKAEMLLTPGVFVRLNDRTAVRMVTPSLSNTRIELLSGQVMVEAAQVEKENHIVVAANGADTRLWRHGIYEFSTNPAWLRVYDGKAEVALSGHSRNAYKGDEIALVDNPKLKTSGFNLKNTESSDDLYAWSKLRADYMAQANMSAAETYYAGGPGWYGAGWYWDPYFASYAWLPGDGFFWDPFGFGFFSPGYWGAWAPYWGYGYLGHGYGWRVPGRAIAGRPGGAITRGSAAASTIRSGGFGGARGGFGAARALGGGMRGGFGGGMRGGFGGGMRGGFGGRR